MEMRPFITVLFANILLLFGLDSNAQVPECCPLVDPLEVYPIYPSEDDSTFVVTSVTTTTVGTHLGYEVIDMGDTIHINSCFKGGVAAQPTNFKDTINIGVRSPGNYVVDFTAYASSSFIECVPADSNSVDLNFSVGFVGIEEQNYLQKQPIMILDILGRPTDRKANTVLVEVFEDGSRRKVIRVE